MRHFDFDVERMDQDGRDAAVRDAPKFDGNVKTLKGFAHCRPASLVMAPTQRLC